MCNKWFFFVIGVARTFQFGRGTARSASRFGPESAGETARGSERPAAKKAVDSRRSRGAFGRARAALPQSLRCHFGTLTCTGTPLFKKTRVVETDV